MGDARRRRPSACAGVSGTRQAPAGTAYARPPGAGLTAPGGVGTLAVTSETWGVSRSARDVAEARMPKIVRLAKTMAAIAIERDMAHLSSWRLIDSLQCRVAA